MTATDAAGNTATQQYDVDQLGAAKSFTFDANGNLTSDGTRTFEWDVRNRLRGVTLGSESEEYAYDGRDRRAVVRRKTNGIVQSDGRVIWCGTSYCEERTAVGAVVERQFSYVRERDGQPQFIGRDHLGSVRSITNATGATVARYQFDPAGRQTVTGADVSRTGFGGYEVKSPYSIQLAVYRAYDPDLGRWLSEDPSGHVDGPNLYSFVESSPVSSRDPLGLMTVRDRLMVNVVAQEDIPRSVSDLNRPPPVAKTVLTSAYYICWCTDGDCGESTLKGEFRLAGSIYVPKRVTRRPARDQSVKDPITAWLHEYAWHIDPALAKARAEAASYEKTYPTRSECDAACKQAMPRVTSAFLRELRDSQDRELTGR